MDEKSFIESLSNSINYLDDDMIRTNRLKSIIESIDNDINIENDVDILLTEPIDKINEKPPLENLFFKELRDKVKPID